MSNDQNLKIEFEVSLKFYFIEVLEIRVPSHHKPNPVTLLPALAECLKDWEPSQLLRSTVSSLSRPQLTPTDPLTVKTNSPAYSPPLTL